MPSHLEIVKANYSRRVELQGLLREIDEKADAENRDYNEQENIDRTEYRSELEACDKRIINGLDMETSTRAIGDAFDHFLGGMIQEQGTDLVDTRSIGKRFVDDEATAAWLKGGGRGTSPALVTDMEYRAVTDLLVAGTQVVPQRLGRIGHDFLDRRVYLIDLLSTIPIQTQSVTYVQDQTPLADMANKAQETTEDTAKPQAGVTMNQITEAAAMIATWTNITRQAAADGPQMMAYLDGRMRYSLKRRTDIQVISGNGTAPNLKGLINRTGIQNYVGGAAEPRAQVMRNAIAQGENVESVYEIVVLNPTDAAIYDLTNYASAGFHANGDDAGSVQSRTAWGLQMVRSTAVAAGTAILLDPTACALLDRQEATAYLTDSHASNFTSNILTMLLEVWVGLALFNPAGVLKATFTKAGPD